MELDKMRNLGDHELAVESKKAAEQLFRLRFQLTLGQTDVVKKVRLLRKDIARFNTIVRERELGLHGAEHRADTLVTEEAAGEAAEKPAKKTAAKKASHVSKARRGAPAPAKKSAAKKATGTKSGAKKAAAKKSAKTTRKTGKKGAR